MASTSRLPTTAIDRLLQAVKVQKEKANNEQSAATGAVPAKRTTPTAASLDEREKIQIAYAKFRAEREKKQKDDEEVEIKKLEKKLSDAKATEVAEAKSDKSRESDPMMQLSTKLAFVETMREFITTSVCRVLKSLYQLDPVNCNRLSEAEIKLDIVKFLNSEWHNYHKGNILPALQKIIDCKFITEPTRLFHSCRILSFDVVSKLDLQGLRTAIVAANKRPVAAARMTLDKFMVMIYGNTTKIFNDIDDETYDRFRALPIPPTPYANGRDLYRSPI